MKKMKWITTLALVSLIFVGCKDKIIQERTYIANVAQYMSRTDFEASVKSTTAKPLENPGKIYFKDQYLFINDRLNGIHIIDNSNPNAPANISYINIPGNRDLVVKGNTLYADSYTDLIAIDVSNPSSITVINRLQDVFLETFPLLENEYPAYGIKDTTAILVAWKVEAIHEYNELSSNYDYGRQCFNCEMMFDNGGIQPMLETASTLDGGISTRNASSGIAGSMSRFALNNDHLYVLDRWTLKVVSIIGDMNLGSEISIWREAETLYPYNGNLFIGTTTGMIIYGLSDPTNPTEISSFNHMNSCDPVAVKGDHAFVTLRSGNSCFGFTDQLDVINISDIQNPYLVKSYPMTNPHGLGIDNNTLFLCDGDDGLKVFDIQSLEEIDQNQLFHFNDINGFDVIPSNGNLMLIGSDGLYQYDYTDLENMSLRSTIRIN